MSSLNLFTPLVRMRETGEPLKLDEESLRHNFVYQLMSRCEEKDADGFRRYEAAAKIFFEVSA